MTQIVSRFEEVIAQFGRVLPASAVTEQTFEQRAPWERIAMNGLQIGSANEIGRLFGDVEKPRAPYRPMPFVEQRCPVCRIYGCGGC